MKLAVCLSGQPRLFKKGFKSLNEHILSKYDCDVFIFTWDNKIGNIKKNQSFRHDDEGSLGEYLKLYNPKSSEIENYTQKKEDFFVKKEQEYGVLREDNFVRRYLAMLYGIFRANELANQYSKAFGTKYDYFLRCRSDVEYGNFELRKSSLVIDGFGNGTGAGQPGDIFAYGTPERMTEYAKLHLLVDKYFYEDKIIPNTEILLAHHLKSSKIAHETCNHVIGVFRPETW